MAPSTSRWDLIDLIYPPKVGGSDGGFGDEGTGVRLDPGGGYLQLEADGTFAGQRGAWAERGTWTSRDGVDLDLVNDLGTRTRCHLHEGKLVRTDHDEEHGRPYDLIYAAAAAPGERGTPKKLEARLERFWDQIVDYDNLDRGELHKLIEEGKAQTVKWLEAKGILDVALEKNQVGAVKMLLAAGYRSSKVKPRNRARLKALQGK
ncbi:MAG: hypothetical protein WCJ30_17740 [Deltaproteobacteria bacterium]